VSKFLHEPNFVLGVSGHVLDLDFFGSVLSHLVGRHILLIYDHAGGIFLDEACRSESCVLFLSPDSILLARGEPYYLLTGRVWEAS
jgi:hypothetical protein